MSIKFYSTRGKYGFLSNFYPAPFNAESDGSSLRWRTSEHYFQAMKTMDLKRREVIRNSTSPSSAASLGRDKELTQIRDDWDSPVDTVQANKAASSIGVPHLTVKDLVMLDAITYKFRQNQSLANLLLQTKPHSLVEESPVDYYWGVGKDNSGKNMLGLLLVYLRDHVLTDKNQSDENQWVTMYVNLFNRLKSYGFVTARVPPSTSQVPIDEAPYKEVQDMRVFGADITGIVDIYLRSSYSEARLKEVVAKMPKDMNYYIVGYLSKPSMLKEIKRVSLSHKVTYISPSELFVVYDKHILTPHTYRVTSASPEYTILASNKDSLSEIDADDLLVKEKAYKRGDIIAVVDFSPHYRVVV